MNWKYVKDILGQQFAIQPVEPREKYSVWNNEERKFYREGDSIQTSIGQMVVGANTKIPEEDKHLKFKKGFVYEIKLQGEEYSVEFGWQIQKQLRDIKRTLESAGVDLNNMNFIISKEGEGLNTQYTVQSVKSDSPSEPIEDEEVEISFNGLDGVEPEGMNEVEKKYVTAYNDYIAKNNFDSASERVKVSVVDGLMKKANISKERAEKLYDNYINAKESSSG